MVGRDYEDRTLGYSILTKNDLEAIHEKTLDIMESHGVCVFGGDAQGILAGAGCEPDSETGLVKFPPRVVEDALESAPPEFTMCGQDPAKDTVVGADHVTFTTFGTGTTIIDPYTGERRDTTLKDLEDITRFADAVDEVDTFTIAVAAQDVEPEIKDLYEGAAVLNNTRKHFGHDTEGGANTRRFIRMAAAVAGGMDKLRERPIISLGACPNSPLEIHEDAGEQIIEAAKAGIPMDILSMGLSGGTTPATMAGTLLTTNCEILAGIVLSQTVSKGTPVFYGSSTTIMDMRLATSPVGAPEHAMYGAAVAQIAKFYQIPNDSAGT
jgi:trimethylamine--corrinoid protein Co-methyltransferase